MQGIYQDLPPEKREEKLKELCTLKEKILVKKEYSEEDINEMKRQMIDNSIAVRKKMEYQKKVKDEVQKFVKPLLSENEYNLNALMNGYAEVKIDVFLFDDQENKMMHTYDREGFYISSRDLFPHEIKKRVVRANPKKKG